MSEIDLLRLIQSMNDRLSELEKGEHPVYSSGSFTPNWVNLTTVGAVVENSGYWTRIGQLAYYVLTVRYATSCASTAGSTHVDNLPFTNSASPGNCEAANGSVTSYGIGRFQASAAGIYPPSWTATSDYVIVTGWTPVA